MGYADTTGVIIYWNIDQPFLIYIFHHVWFDEYNYHLSIGEKHTTGSLLLWQYHEINIHNSDLINLIPCEIDLTTTTFCDTKIITYEIELPTSGKKVRFHLMDDEYFIILYINDTIPNSPAGHKIPTQAKQNVCIISIN